MPRSVIYSFSAFDDFHRMANGGLQSRHGDVQVFRFSDISRDAVTETPLFKTQFYQVGLFESVRFEVAYFGRVQSVEHRNAVVLFKPGQAVSFRKADPEARGYAIMFQEHFIDWRLQNSRTLRDFSILDPSRNCVLFLDDESFRDLVDIAAKMHHEYLQALDAHTLHLLGLYCQVLIHKLNRHLAVADQAPMPSVQFDTVQRFKQLVYQHVHETKRVSDYAEMLFVTEKTLHNHFVQVQEGSPKDFIQAVIIEESKAMLRHQATVEQVADYFHFTDQSHFSHFFKKKTGQTPLSFRKR